MTTASERAIAEVQRRARALVEEGATMEDVQRKARELASAAAEAASAATQAAGQLLEEGPSIGDVQRRTRELAGDMSDAFFKVVSNAKNLMPLPLPPPPPPPPPPFAVSLSTVWATLLVILLTVIILRLRKQRAEILRLQKALVLKEKEIGRVFVDKERELTRVYADSERELNRVHVLKEKEIVAAIEQAAAAAPESPGSQTRAKGQVRGIDAMNNALWRMGALKHAPPSFKYFDPVMEEQRAIIMKEVKLPRAQQTHELCYEPTTRCLFVSQMSNSVLVRIPVGSDGMLLDDQDAWNVGPAHPETGDGISGLHNVSRSVNHPGCLWLTLQFSNTLVLLDAATMGVRQVIKCPQLLERDDGTLLRIGGPHALVECGRTGDIWVALKGSVPCHPGVTGSSKASLASAITRVCCDPAKIKERMEAVAKHEASKAKPGEAVAPNVLGELPEGFAIWRLTPDKYDPKDKKAYGGKLFETEPSPPMVAIDTNCDCWVVQDKAPKVMHIGPNGAEQIRVPLPSDDPSQCLQMTGPAIMTAPDGGVWSTLFGADGGLARFEHGSKNLYQLGCEGIGWLKATRFIHMRFVSLKGSWFIFNNVKFEWPKFNMMVLISSNLVDDTAINAITCVGFNPFVGSGWVAPLWRKDIPLPTQDCCCHRVEIISDGDGDQRVTAVVSELASSRVFQVKLQNLEIYDYLKESVSTKTTPCGREYQVFDYEHLGGPNSASGMKNRPATQAMKDSLANSLATLREYSAQFEPTIVDGVKTLHMPDAEVVNSGDVADRPCTTPEQHAAYEALVKGFRAMSPGMSGKYHAAEGVKATRRPTGTPYTPAEEVHE